MWQFLVKAAIGSIIMKSKPIKKMVKRFMRGAVKKLGKTAGTLIGGAALMIMGGYATNGAYGFAKGFFGGAGAASQAKSVFDLVGRAKDAFSTAGSEMTSFTEFLKGGVDKVGAADPLTEIEVTATKRGPLELFTDEAGNIIGDKATAYDPMLGLDQGAIEGEVVTTATQADVLAAQRANMMGPPITVEQMGPSITAEQAELKAASAVPPPDPAAQPWYKKAGQWMEENPKTTSALQAGLGLLADQGPPAPPQQDPMMMGIGGYTGYGTSQTEAWRAYAPEYVAYSVDNQLNPNSYVNYMSALG